MILSLSNLILLARFLHACSQQGPQQAARWLLSLRKGSPSVALWVLKCFRGTNHRDVAWQKEATDEALEGAKISDGSFEAKAAGFRRDREVGDAERVFGSQEKSSTHGKVEANFVAGGRVVGKGESKHVWPSSLMHSIELEWLVAHLDARNAVDAEEFGFA